MNHGREEEKGRDPVVEVLVENSGSMVSIHIHY